MFVCVCFVCVCLCDHSISKFHSVYVGVSVFVQMCVDVGFSCLCLVCVLCVMCALCALCVGVCGVVCLIIPLLNLMLFMSGWVFVCISVCVHM